jgi:hypothetical protein
MSIGREMTLETLADAGCALAVPGAANRELGGSKGRPEVVQALAEQIHLDEA